MSNRQTEIQKLRSQIERVKNLMIKDAEIHKQKMAQLEYEIKKRQQKVVQIRKQKKKIFDEGYLKITQSGYGAIAKALAAVSNKQAIKHLIIDNTSKAFIQNGQYFQAQSSNKTTSLQIKVPYCTQQLSYFKNIEIFQMITTHPLLKQKYMNNFIQVFNKMPNLKVFQIEMHESQRVRQQSQHYLTKLKMGVDLKIIYFYQHPILEMRYKDPYE